MNALHQPSHVSSYLDGPPRQVPGFSSLHRMVMLLLAERVPSDGRVLVLGAGGGLEIKALAEAQPGWLFDGVDPSHEMIELAEQTVGLYRNRIVFHEGYIDCAPKGPFDGAISLLTFHFIAREQRLDTLKMIHQRLKKGAPLVVAHISIPSPEPERSLWISRHLTFPDTSEANSERAKSAMKAQLSILSPEEEEEMMRGAGFSGVSLFYAGLSFRGWVAYAA